MTEHVPSLGIGVRGVTSPDGRPMVLFQTDDWHILIPPAGARAVAAALLAVADDLLD